MLSNQPSSAHSLQVVGGGSLFHLSFWKWCREIEAVGELAIAFRFFHFTGLEDCVCCSLFFMKSACSKEMSVWLNWLQLRLCKQQTSHLNFTGSMGLIKSPTVVFIQLKVESNASLCAEKELQLVRFCTQGRKYLYWFF